MIAADGRPTTIFAHLYNPNGFSWGWSLFAFDGGRRDALAQLQQACVDVKAWGSVRPRLVPAVAVAKHDDATVLYDLDGEAHAAYGIKETAALVLDAAGRSYRLPAPRRPARHAAQRLP